MSVSIKRLDQLKRVGTVLAALRDKAEGDAGTTDWRMVYLDNARQGMPEKQFRACLASLAKRGLYRVVDGWAWGEVKVTDKF